MRTATHFMQFMLAGAIVVILGATLGWYVFVHRAVITTETTDAARGAGLAPSFGSPAGSNFSNANGGGAAAPAADTTATGVAAPRLWHIALAPVAGMSFEASSTARLLFVERADGNVMRADPSLTAVTRLTNTLLPKIYEAQFAGQTALMRAVDASGAVTTYAGAVRASTSTGQVGTLDGVYLPQDIRAIVPKTSTQLFFIVRDPHGGSMGITAGLRGQQQKRVFVSALSSWRALAPGDGTIVLAQSAADGVLGYSFTLKTDGSLVPLVSGVPGLVMLPRASSTALLWSSSGESGLALFGRTARNASTVALPIKTTAEKCVWAPGLALVAYCAVPRAVAKSAFLANWYAGALHTTDAWWRVDVSAGTAEQFFATDSTLSLDVVDPTIDPSGTYIAFRNNTDQSLWMLRIPQ